MKYKHNRKVTYSRAIDSWVLVILGGLVILTVLKFGLLVQSAYGLSEWFSKLEVRDIPTPNQTLVVKPLDASNIDLVSSPARYVQPTAPVTTLVGSMGGVDVLRDESTIRGEL